MSVFTLICTSNIFTLLAVLLFLLNIFKHMSVWMMIFLKVLVDNYIKYNIQTCYNVCFQSSKDLLLQFSRDFLSGEGDITRHLGYLGYKTTYTQTALDEFDFAVKNLATDLRDGVRLTYIHLKLYFQSMMF